MTKKEIIKRLQSKLIKIGVYKRDAEVRYGTSIAKELFEDDIDFISSTILLLTEEEGN